jgi:hypothetical protein
MKTNTILLAAIFTLQIGFLFAGNENLTTTTAEVNPTIHTISIAPSAPMEALFEDMTMDNTFFGLSPVTPAEASFEDFSLEMISINELSPAIPSVADFTDAIDQVSFDPGQLSPVTPLEADFE